MGRKLRHLLMFLLIILKEPNMPEADCSCAPSSRCYCVNMGLTSIPQNLPTSIDYLLHLDYNKITKIQPGAFANLLRLELLFLASNQITMIQPGAFVNLPRLSVLSLSHNRLTMIHAYTFANLPQLVRLDLFNNQIAKIQDGTFANLTQLKWLLLQRNLISMIQSDLLANLINLKTLRLSYNEITMLQEGSFANMPQLQCLDLRNNKVSAIASLAFGFLPLNVVIQVEGNPWQCDCKMVPFMQNTNQFHSFKDQIICAEPANLRGQNLTDVKLEELVCAEPTMALLTDSQVTSHNGYNGTAAGSATGPVSKSLNIQTILDRPDGDSSKESVPSFSIPVLVGSVCGSIAGIALIGAVILTIWCKKRTKNPPSCPISNIAWDNVAKSATVLTSGHDQTGQGQTQANTQPLNVENLPHNVLAALKPNPIYTGVTKDQASSAMASGHDQTGQGQGQSQAITESNRNTRARAMTSEHDHPYKDIEQHNQTGYGQSQAIPEFNTNTTAAVMTIANDHQYEDIDQQHIQGQSHAIIGSNTKNTAIVETSDHGQSTGQGQSQATIEGRNQSYGTGQIVSMQCSIYKVVGHSNHQI